MTNDWWCRDETESLMWARTHGWATRHALVSRLIVVIHYGTIPRCSLLWTSSQSDRCILSQHAAISYPNLSPVSYQIPSHEFVSIFSLGVTCFSTLKYPHSNLGTRFFLRGEGCDTPGVSFVLRRENYPNLECSVKISISRSRMSLISQTIRTHITEFGVIQSHKRPNLEPVKTFISRNECELDNHSRIINLIWSSLNQTLNDCYLLWARVKFLGLRPMSDYFIWVRTLKRNTQYVAL
jgi:hypothetical protein